MLLMLGKFKKNLDGAIFIFVQTFTIIEIDFLE